MSAKTKISWCDSTASPWYGCTKVSPGCKNCYAEGWAHRAGRDVWGKGKARQRSKSFEAQCRKWNGLLAMDRERRRIFPSLCDWLDEEVPIEWLADFLRVIHDCSNLDFLLLTKRPENWLDRVSEAFEWIECEGPSSFERDQLEDWVNSWMAAQDRLTGGTKHGSGFPSNAWIGVSVEDQRRADERIPLLLQIPAKVRFLSVEPLLEPVRINKASFLFDKSFHELTGEFRTDPITGKRQFGVRVPKTAPRLLHWVIVGGESGAKRRDCGVEAIVDVARQCQSAGVPVWVKQDCALRSEQQGRIPEEIWNLKQLP